MNAPYKGTFRVSQIYKGAAHDGLDLVGISSKDVYATVSGTVSRAGWENPTNCKQGFGQYVRIDCKIGGMKCCAYYGHLSKIGVKVGDTVAAGDLIGIEGNTGHSTGSHVHYCISRSGIKGQQIDICAHSGIPNACATYGDAAAPAARTLKVNCRGEDVRSLQAKLIAEGYSCGPCGVDGIYGAATIAAVKAYQRNHRLQIDGIVGVKTRAELTK